MHTMQIKRMKALPLHYSLVNTTPLLHEKFVTDPYPKIPQLRFLASPYMQLGRVIVPTRFVRYL
jgi:hypothetical protein